jgi:4'-phosphopantetheinyl transferase
VLRERWVPDAGPAVTVVLATSVAVDRVVGLLDVAERARVAAVARPQDAADRASAHALLRLVVGPVVGRGPASLVFTATCRTCGGPHGRPELVGAPALGLSLSHAAGLVAVAVSTAGRVGVDVELVSATDFDGFERVALAPGEQARTPAERARTWVRKEALLKATGHGLAVEPRSVVLSGPGGAPRLLAWTGPEHPGPVELRDVAVDGPDTAAVDGTHAAAVAVLGTGGWTLRVRRHTW